MKHFTISPPGKHKIRGGISVRLFLTTFALLALMVAGMSWAVYDTSSRIIVENQRRTMLNLMDHTHRYLTMVQGYINSVLLAVAANESLWELSRTDVEKSLQVYAGYLPFFDKLYILKNDGTIAGYPQSTIRSLGYLVAPVLLQEFRSSGDGIHYSEPYFSPLSHWTISVGVSVFTREGERPGIVVVDIPLLLFKDLLPGYSFKDVSAFFLMTNRGTPVYSDPANLLVPYRLNTNTLEFSQDNLDGILASGPAEIFDMEIRGESYACLAGDALDYGGWKPVILMSREQLRQARGSVLRTTGQMVIFITAASLAISWLVARRFAQPLEKLTNEMERVQAGSLHGIAIPKRRDEIGTLTVAFNDMMDRIRNLIGELQRSELQKREAEIKALQAQVNPHFLYNTLNAVAHSSSLARQDDVYDMISSLTHVLSFSLEKTSKMVLLAHELEVIRHCINLMRISMGREFELRYDIKPGIGGCLIPKLILQPIVENSIFHGFAGMEEGACLWIKAGTRGERLVIQVIDNGNGIADSALLDRPADGRIGLKSIRERLSVLYQEDFEFTIGANTPSGTCVTVVLPFRLVASAPPAAEEER